MGLTPTRKLPPDSRADALTTYRLIALLGEKDEKKKIKMMVIIMILKKEKMIIITIIILKIMVIMAMVGEDEYYTVTRG